MSFRLSPQLLFIVNRQKYFNNGGWFVNNVESVDKRWTSPLRLLIAIVCPSDVVATQRTLFSACSKNIFDEWFDAKGNQRTLLKC